MGKMADLGFKASELHPPVYEHVAERPQSRYKPTSFSVCC